MVAAGEAAVIMAVGAAAVGVTVEDGEAAAGAAPGHGVVAVGAVEDGAAMEATAEVAGVGGMDSGYGSVEDFDKRRSGLCPKRRSPERSVNWLGSAVLARRPPCCDAINF
jgi:hypothetical protein